MIGALGLFGCGGSSGDDDDDEIVFPDADTTGGPDADVGDVCNPVSQTGCAAGEKCAFIIDDLDLGAGHVGCAPDGTQARGAECTEAAAVGGTDNCVRGNDCYRGTCMEICTTVNDQCSDGSCVPFSDGAGNPLPINICLPNCNLLTQDCPAEGEGCYLAGNAVCVGAGTADLGETCMFANSCLPGMVCVGSDEGGFVCRNFCGPWEETFDETSGEVLQCASPGTFPSVKQCGTTTNNICFAIGDGMMGVAHDTAGVCIPDDAAECDCQATPICPPAE
jgi:hypothetical protein